MIINFNFNLIILSIFCNLTFARFYENILIFNIPINQLILIYLLITTPINLSLKTINTKLNFSIYYFFIIFGSLQIIFGFFKNGIYAIRDGLYIIDSFYIIIGFFYSKKFFENNYILKFYKILITIGIIFIIIKFFKLDLLIDYSITSINNIEYNLFNLVGLRLIWLWCFFIILCHFNTNNLLIILIALFFLFASIILEQVRTLYLGFFATIIFLSYTIKFKNINKFNLIYILLILLLFYNFFEFSFKGRMSDFSFKFLIDHFLSLFFIGDSSDSIQSSIGSANLRILWWKNLTYEIFTNPFYLIFGKGFGIPLTDFMGYGSIVREPHNMYITSLARQGFIGFLLFLFFKLKLIKILITNLKKLDNDSRTYIVTLSIFNLFIFIFFLSDSILNYSYISMPYYFLWGIFLQKISLLKK